PPRHPPGAHGSPRLDLAGQIFVTLIHQHLSLPRHVIGWLTGTHPDTISKAITTISPLLARHKIRTAPAPAPLRTPADLISYAAANSIRLPPKIKTTGY